MGTIARELITLLRYEIDDSALKKFERMLPNNSRAPGNVPGLPTPAVIDRTNSLLGRLGGIVRASLAGIGVATLARMSDEFAGVEGRVGLVTNGIEEQKHALASLMAVAQETGQKYTAVAGLFTSVQRNAKELGLALDETLELSRTIGAALTIGGGSAQSQEAALVQLQQALGSGTLRGEELNSILEQAPRLAQAIAESFNVPVGKLRELGQAGKLTSKELAKGLLKQSAKLRAEYESMPKTFSRSMTMLGNKIGEVAYRINKATRAAEMFFRATSLVLENFDDLLKAAASLAGAVLFSKLAGAAKALGGAAGLLRRALVALPWLKSMGRMLAVATALFYVFDDIGVWFQGGDSLLGDVIGPMSEWKWLADSVVGALTWVKALVGSSASSVTQFASKWGLVGVIIGGVVAMIGAIPTLLVAGVLAWISVFRTNWAQLGDDIMYGLGMLGDHLASVFIGAWDAVKAKAAEVWNAIAAMVQAAVPEWARKGISMVAGAIGGPAAAVGASTLMGGAAAVPTRPGAAGSSAVSNSITNNITATSSQPAAIAEAARRGTERGMGSAMVPNVEASR